MIQCFQVLQMKVKNFTTLSSRIESSGLILISGPDDFFKIECKNILLKKFKDAEFYDYFGDEITIKKKR